MRQLARVLVLLVGSGLAVVGLLGGAAGLASAVSAGGGVGGLQGTAAFSGMALPVVLGSGLAWHALQSLQGKPSREFRLRQVWPLIVAFVAAVVAGQLVLSRSAGPSLQFAPLHLLAGSLPPLAVVALVSRRLSPSPRWRDVTLLVSSGAIVSTGLALSFELVLVLSVAAALLRPLGSATGAPEGIQAWAERLQDPTWLQDSATLDRLAQSPEMIGLALLFVAGLVPLIEEAVKTIGVGLLAYRRPPRSLAFVWGVCSGAGFALTEGLLNSLVLSEGWASLILLRVGATLLHSLAGGLTGLAWHSATAERRWGRVLLLYASAVGVHALWNGITVGYVVALLQSGALTSASGGIAPAAGLSLGILSLLVSLAVGIGGALALLTRRLRQLDSVPPVPGG